MKSQKLICRLFPLGFIWFQPHCPHSGWCPWNARVKTWLCVPRTLLHATCVAVDCFAYNCTGSWSVNFGIYRTRLAVPAKQTAQVFELACLYWVARMCVCVCCVCLCGYWTWVVYLATHDAAHFSGVAHPAHRLKEFLISALMGS